MRAPLLWLILLALPALALAQTRPPPAPGEADVRFEAGTQFVEPGDDSTAVLRIAPGGVLVIHLPRDAQRVELPRVPAFRVESLPGQLVITHLPPRRDRAVIRIGRGAGFGGADTARFTLSLRVDQALPRVSHAIVS
ncbi:MAG: hypothetical protein SF002_11055 [Alphaproteobacteria bacterium]|nr:hypothetical protein [Alphaproteobacteria bacterium]